EGERAGDAGIDADRRRVGIAARHEALGATGIDAVDAERALGRNADLLVVEARLFRNRRLLAEGEFRMVHLEARLIGAGDGAIGAADAEIVVDGDDAVGALAGRGRRADMHAGRVGAVLAAGRHIDALHIRIFADLDVEHAAPLHARR